MADIDDIDLPNLAAFDEDNILASICRESFWEFCVNFWECIPGAGKPVFNWHMEYIASEIQFVAERVIAGLPKLYDLVINLPPGTSKSSLVSILFPAWLWTRMPGCRLITASHTSDLVLDLASKSRDVIQSEKYQRCFPGIGIREDTAAKGHYRNTQGGERKSCTVAGVSPIGHHADFIMCLPYDMLVETDRGVLPIGKVVEESIPTKVLAFDHVAGRSCWQDVEKFETSPGRSVCRMHLSDGSWVDATDEHPIYVVNKGYIPINQVVSGDEVIYAPPLRSLRQGVLHLTGACDQSEDALLFEGVFGEKEDRSWTPAICQNSSKLSWLRQRVHVDTDPKQHGKVLQHAMPDDVVACNRSSSVEDKNFGSLWLLRKGTDYSSTRNEENKILRSSLRWERPFYQNQGEGQSELYSWGWLRRLQSGFRQVEAKGQAAGKSLLFYLWDYQKGKWEEPGRASCGLEQEERLHGEFDCGMSCLSYGVSGNSLQTVASSKKVVVSVEREVWLPEKVYNLRVANTHNYFANGILVHNCDDPIDPDKVLSEVELKKARKFIIEDIDTRKTDKMVSVTILVMQRLGVGDPSDEMLKQAEVDGSTPVKHICLPSDLDRNEDGGWLESEVIPQELAKRYVNGLLDPHRLPMSVLRGYKARGIHFYTTQFRQKPYSKKGGMFEEEYFSQRVKAAPYRARRVRAWDLACLVSGTLVTTDRGDITIESVNNFDKVLTRAGWRAVRWAGKTKTTRELVEVIFDAGVSIVGTPDHPVWTVNRGWVRLDSLVGDDQCVFFRSGQCRAKENTNQTRKLSSLMGSRTPGDQARNILKHGDGIKCGSADTLIHYIGLSGDTTMATSPLSMTYIMWMGTTITIKSVIWNVSAKSSTVANTILWENGTIVNKKRKVNEKRIERRCGKTLSGKIWPANSVVNNLNPEVWDNFPKFVLQFVETENDLASSQKPVWCVEPLLLGSVVENVAQKFAGKSSGIGTVSVVVNHSLVCTVRNIVLENAIWNDLPAIPVYDLQVEDDHEFFANGVLVHNSSEESPGACYTAGVLMAIEKDGSIYVEHVVHGQWEPKRRDDIIKAVAMRDRSRYGPNNEPTILIEHEGGSAGISAYKATARHLAGFPVVPYRPTGKKEVRARPWSSQLAAKNVYLVDNGESQGLGRSDWNINEYASEHLAFPLGRLKDQVDASAMAMTWLTDAPQAKGIRILSPNQVGNKGKELRLVVCRSSELDDLELDQRCLLLDLNDPVDTPSEPVTALELRSRLTTLVDNLELRFAPIDPAEYQERWHEPVPDYGKPPDQLVLSRELGRKLWGFLLRKRDAFPEVVVIRDDDDGRALSVAYAICDMLRLLSPPEQGRKPIRRIYQVSDPERKHDADPPIRHVYAMVKATRAAVV